MDSSEELQDYLEEVAQDIAELLPDTSLWSGYLAYLLEVLEEEALDIDMDDLAPYEDMLKELRGAISNRLSRGAW